MIESLQSVDVELRVIIVAVLGLLLFAVISSVVIAMFVRPIERKMHQAAQQIHKLETGKTQEGELGTALSIVGGIALFMLTFIGVLTIAKGMGLGAMGKGVGILAFTGGAAALWAIYALVRRGQTKWVFGGLGVTSAIVATWFGLTVQEEHVKADEAIAQLSQEIKEVGHELEVDIKEAVGGAGEELFAASGDAIPIGRDSEIEEEKPSDSGGVAAIPIGDAGMVIGESSEPVPDWVHAPPAGDQKVISSDPFLSERLAREDVEQKLTSWALVRESQSLRGIDESELLDQEAIDELWSRAVRQEHVQGVMTSVGETFVVHALVQKDEEHFQLIAQKVDEFVAERDRRRGLMAVSAGGGGVLLALSALYGVLSMGGKRPAA